MVRIHEWKEFESKARSLFAKNPDSTRFSLKHTSKSSVAGEKNATRKVNLVLKVTNGSETITFESSERFYVKRVCSLMQWFTVKMASTPVEALGEEQALKQRLPR